MDNDFDAAASFESQDSLPPSGVNVGSVIAARYRVSRLIAEGGMATVYLAEDLRHSRMVAVKVLHEALTHTIGIQRFLREIEVVARLQHPHLLTLIDSGTNNGFPYYVMPYLEALSLREWIIEKGQLPLTEAVTITREIADGLAYAHERGVVHRDIKPSNILMSDGHAVVVDFGIATAIRKSSVGRITVNGSSLGSPTYMSPEQAAGEHDIDARSDVYSLACVLYEMLIGRPPIEHVSMQHMLMQKLTGEYEPLRKQRPDLPVALEAVLLRALAPDREARFTSMVEFSQAVEASVPQKSTLSTRNRWLIAAAALIVVSGSFAYAQHQQKLAAALTQVAEVERLVRTGKLFDAYQLAEQVRLVLPGDTTLEALRSVYSDTLKIVTAPAGATVSVALLNGNDTAWQNVGVTPVNKLSLPKFMYEKGYRIRLERAGYEPVDVQANLFVDLTRFGGPAPLDTVFLDTVSLPTSGMAHIRGFRFPNTRTGPYTASDYHIGKREVTNREYMRFVAAGGYRDRKYWTEPMILDGKEISWDQAMTEFRDQSGQAGPATWTGGTFPEGKAEYPVGGVSWYEATAYARYAGMQLPTSLHWTRAATRNVREAGFLYLPSSNLNGTGVRRSGIGTMSAYGLFDVTGNVREWNVNAIDSARLTRGGTFEDSPFQSNHLIPRPAFDRSPTNGFRVARYTDPDSIVSLLSKPIQRNPPRDFRGFKAVSDAEFAVYRRMYDYDKSPLETRLELSGETADTRWQKVSFAAGYSGPRMAAYLIYPKHSNGPFEPVILWESALALSDRQFNPNDRGREFLAGFIPQSGRMIVVPLYFGTYERDDSNFSITQSTPDSSAKYRDLTVQWIKDLRRTIDFLETRNDVQSDRIGFYSVSWGGILAPIALAIEPRIKAAVLYSAGYTPGISARTEVDASNYAPRVHTPTLMLNGKYDTVFPYETSQLPMYEQLGTPLNDKHMISSENGHMVSVATFLTESRAWFDKYLSAGRPLTAARK